MSATTSISVPEHARPEVLRHRRLAWQVPLGLLVCAVLSLAIDARVAAFFAAGGLPNFWQKILSISEAFSHGVGATVIVLVAWLLDPRRRTDVLRIGIATLLGGTLANVTKLLVARTRARHFDLSEPILDSFVDFLPMGLLESRYEGFPSAHTATAFALAVALSWRYPAARLVFFTVALLAGGQRMMAGAHFASDVFAGAALGAMAGYLCLPGGLLGRHLDRWARRLSPKLDRRP